LENTVVAELIYKIPIADLKTIRVTHKGIVTELPLNVRQATDFLQHQQKHTKMPDAAIAAVLGIISDLIEAQKQVSGDFGIEFVIADPDKT
jgi:hypothetical protein